jgi:hypothetical protein
MARASTKVIPEKRGPRGKGKDPLIALRMPSEERQAVEAWVAKQENKLSLSKAIRHLVQVALASEGKVSKTRGTK